ncbi:MAG: sensor histidine kinase [Crocinitomicaceae bacterium]
MEILNRLLTPPSNNYDQYYKQGAFELTWRYYAIMLLLYLLLIVAGAFVNGTILLNAFFSWLVPLGSLLYLYKSRRYEIVAYFHVIMGGISPGIVLNMNVVPFHIIEFLYMIIVVFYAFVTLRRKIGVAVLIVQFIWFLAYIIRMPEPITEATTGIKLAMILATFVALTLFGVLILEFLRLRRRSENNYLSINRDLNEANQIVNTQYQEKTVMLKEIHHRVKNNLQVISSLLRLQSYEIEQESSRVHFQDAIGRVSAMALIHEKMYQNENLSQIDLKNYVHTLAEDLIRNQSHSIPIKLSVETDLQSLGNDTLVPVALILNELITNSLKHAFNDVQEGFIDISIAWEKDNTYFRLSYKDSGQWKSNVRPASFGLELITTLTEQLDGKVERTFDNGTKYEFLLKDMS